MGGCTLKIFLKKFFQKVLQGRKKVVPLQPQNGRKFFEKDERKRSGTLKPRKGGKRTVKELKEQTITMESLILAQDER